MSRTTTYQVRRGGTYRFVLASPLGTSLTATCQGDLRELDAGENEIDGSPTVAASFTVTDFAGDAERGPGFYLTLTSAATLSLEKGKRYLADAIVTISAEDYVQRSWIIEVLEPATVA